MLQSNRVPLALTHPFFLYTSNEHQVAKIQWFKSKNHTGFAIFVVFFFSTSFLIEFNDFFEAKKLQKSLLCLR